MGQLGKITLDDTPVDAEVEAGITSNWAYDHKAATTAIHGAGSDHLALFDTASTVVSRVIWKDASEEALDDLNRTTSLSWTDLDLTAYTSANAKLTILRVQVHIDSIDAGAANFIHVYIRKNGTTPAAYAALLVDGISAAAGSYRQITIITGLDSGQVCEYYLNIGGTIQVDTYINVLGYIE